MSIARLSEVGVRKGDSWILKNVNFEIGEGQRWVISGPNGAGKTTLLRILATQLFPSTGEVEILDERLGAVDVFELRPRIGLTSAALLDQFEEGEKVIDIALTAAWGFTGRWQEEYAQEDVARAHSLLHLMEVDHLSERVFGTLSEGEKKRVQLARALMPNPELLLLDEPAAGMDIGARESMLLQLAIIALDPLSPATVMVTHHLEEIPIGTSHAIILKEGEVMAAGPIDDVITSVTVSLAFGMNIKVSFEEGRWSART
jgi:iron complex transport system ATP-binding protein